MTSEIFQHWVLRMDRLIRFQQPLLINERTIILQLEPLEAILVAVDIFIQELCPQDLLDNESSANILEGFMNRDYGCNGHRLSHGLGLTRDCRYNLKTGSATV